MFAPIGGATGANWVTDDPSSAPALDAYGDPIIHLHDPWRFPGGTFSHLAFGPGPHSASEADFTAVRFDNDPACIYFSAAPEGLLNLAFDLGGRHTRFELDRIYDTLDTLDRAYRPFRLVALIIPLDLAFEGNPPLIDDHLDVLAGHRQAGLDHRNGVAGDLGIRSLVCRVEARLYVVRQSTTPATRFAAAST
jgi:hypothetical protein